MVGNGSLPYQRDGSILVGQWVICAGLFWPASQLFSTSIQGFSPSSCETHYLLNDEMSWKLPYLEVNPFNKLATLLIMH